MRFLASGGHPVLLAQRNGFPTLLHNDFLFRCLVLLLPRLSGLEAPDAWDRGIVGSWMRNHACSCQCSNIEPGNQWFTATVPLHRSRDDVYGEQLFRVDNDDLQPGTYTIGIYNMDYFVHQSFSYQLAVRGAGTA